MNKSRPLSIRLPNDLNHAVQNAARSKGESKSGIVIQALKDFFDTKPPVSCSTDQLERRLRSVEQAMCERLISVESRVDRNEAQLCQIKIELDTWQSTALAIRKAQESISSPSQRPVGWSS